MPGLRAQGLRQSLREAPGGKNRDVDEGLVRVGLPVLPTGGVAREEQFVNAPLGLISGRLLDQGAAELKVVGGDHLDHLLENIAVGHVLLEWLAQVVHKLQAQGLFACHQRQTSRETLDHEVGGQPHPGFVGLEDEVLQREVKGRLAGDGDAALDHRGDDLTDRLVNSRQDQPLELQALSDVL